MRRRDPASGRREVRPSRGRGPGHPPALRRAPRGPDRPREDPGGRGADQARARAPRRADSPDRPERGDRYLALLKELDGDARRRGRGAIDTPATRASGSCRSSTKSVRTASPSCSTRRTACASSPPARYVTRETDPGPACLDRPRDGPPRARGGARLADRRGPGSSAAPVREAALRGLRTLAVRDAVDPVVERIAVETSALVRVAIADYLGRRRWSGRREGPRRPARRRRRERAASRPRGARARQRPRPRTRVGGVGRLVRGPSLLPSIGGSFDRSGARRAPSIAGSAPTRRLRSSGVGPRSVPTRTDPTAIGRPRRPFRRLRPRASSFRPVGRRPSPVVSPPVPPVVSPPVPRRVAARRPSRRRPLHARSACPCSCRRLPRPRRLRSSCRRRLSRRAGTVAAAFPSHRGGPLSSGRRGARSTCSCRLLGLALAAYVVATQVRLDDAVRLADGSTLSRAKSGPTPVGIRRPRAAGRAAARSSPRPTSPSSGTAGGRSPPSATACARSAADSRAQVRHRRASSWPRSCCSRSLTAWRWRWLVEALGLVLPGARGGALHALRRLLQPRRPGRDRRGRRQGLLRRQAHGRADEGGRVGLRRPRRRALRVGALRRRRSSSRRRRARAGPRPAC